MSRWDNLVPFDPQTGGQMHFPEKRYTQNPDGKSWGYAEPEWRENSIFEDTLTFVGFERGRSAAYGIFQRLDGSRCSMFLSDLEVVVPRLAHGRIHGKFTWCKRGANFGIKAFAPPAIAAPMQQTHAGDRR